MANPDSAATTQNHLLKRTPLFQWHKNKGAKMVPFAGYEMPINYTLGTIAEHHHTRQQAGLFDISHMGVIKIALTDENISKLEHIIPSDIKEMSIGESKYGLLIFEKGTILDDLIISKYKDYLLLVVNAGCKEQDYLYIKQRLSCQLLEDIALLALQGPQARQVLSELCPAASHLTFMQTGLYNFLGSQTYISCSGYTGEDGFEFIIPKDAAIQVVDTLTDFQSVTSIGLSARNSLRLEAGLCLYGQDMDNQLTPVEANLMWAIGKRQKQENKFIGANLIQLQMGNKTLIKRVGLKSVDKGIAREGALIYNNKNEKIGHITSGVPSPTLNLPIAMGYVTSDQSTLNTEVYVKIREKLYPYLITKMPFVNHNYYRG